MGSSGTATGGRGCKVQEWQTRREKCLRMRHKFVCDPELWNLGRWKRCPSLKRFFLVSAFPGQFPLFRSVASSLCCPGALCPAECSSAEPFFSGGGLWDTREDVQRLIGSEKTTGSNFLTTLVYCHLDTTYVDVYE